ncbi:YpmS family protein [Bacillus badius]|uniref:YpmS family protein n=1 Tax=Bacillus badius TaxID=1455 RepID=UPI002E1CC3C4|nr:YpmS family protein [Bacillus badius]
MNKKWKLAFLGLLTLNVIIVLILAIALFSPVKDEPLPKAQPEKEAVEFHVQSNKEDLNRVIKTFIEKEKAKSFVDYNVYLRDQVELYGDIAVFSERINYKLSFEPEALKNGNVILRQKGIKVGRINLPVSYVLKAARDAYQFPDWVRIMPNDELIYISLDKMKLESDLKVKADRIDLKKDDIRFTFQLPTE